MAQVEVRFRENEVKREAKWVGRMSAATRQHQHEPVMCELNETVKAQRRAQEWRNVLQEEGKRWWEGNKLWQRGGGCGGEGVQEMLFHGPCTGCTFVEGEGRAYCGGGGWWHLGHRGLSRAGRCGKGEWDVPV